MAGRLQRVGSIVEVALVVWSLALSVSSQTIIGAMHEDMFVDGNEVGRCWYTNEKGKEVTLTLTKHPGGKSVVESSDPGVKDPPGAYQKCLDQSSFSKRGAAAGHGAPGYEVEVVGVPFEHEPLEREVEVVPEVVEVVDVPEEVLEVVADPVDEFVLVSNPDEPEVYTSASVSEDSSNGITSGSCSYTDDNLGDIKISYTKDLSGRLRVDSKPLLSGLIRKLYGCRRAAGYTGEIKLPSTKGKESAHSTENRKYDDHRNGGDSGEHNVYDLEFQAHGIKRKRRSVSSQQMQYSSAVVKEGSLNGVTKGSCTYTDENNKQIVISYTKSSNGSIEVASKPEVENAKTKLSECRKAAGLPPDVQASAAALPGLGSTSVKISAAAPTIATQFSSVSIEEGTDNGVTKGTCSYTDENNVVIKITYSKDSKGVQKVESEPAVSDIEDKLAGCRKAAGYPAEIKTPSEANVQVTKTITLFENTNQARVRREEPEEEHLALRRNKRNHRAKREELAGWPQYYYENLPYVPSSYQEMPQNYYINV